MIASDLNNPDFVGATNPDSRLSATFYSKPLRNNYKSEAEGRPIFEDVDFVRILVPGDNNNVIDTPARDDHKARFPLQWAHYQNKVAGDSRAIGTPVSEWPLITKAQAEELKALKFFTVELIANASDSQIQSLGMVAGMSPHAFRERAQRYLAMAAGEADATKQEARLKELQEENERIRAETEQKLAEMQAQMQVVLSAVAEKGAANGKRGSKKADAVEAGGE
jgi:hypothetical protein